MPDKHARCKYVCGGSSRSIHGSSDSSSSGGEPAQAPTAKWQRRSEHPGSDENPCLVIHLYQWQMTNDVHVYYHTDHTNPHHFRDHLIFPCLDNAEQYSSDYAMTTPTRSPQQDSEGEAAELDAGTVILDEAEVRMAALYAAKCAAQAEADAETPKGERTLERQGFFCGCSCLFKGLVLLEPVHLLH